MFVAAPLALVTGLLMSEWWPKNATALNKAFPAPVARALHFPTMIFFVFFIVVHVILVFATGALPNLNHMFTGTRHGQLDRFLASRPAHLPHGRWLDRGPSAVHRSVGESLQPGEQPLTVIAPVPPDALDRQ